MKQLFRALGAKILYYSGFIDILIKILKRYTTKEIIIVLIYHRFVLENDVYLDKGPVVHKLISDFEKEIYFLSKHFHFVSVKDVGLFLNGSMSLPKYSVAITTDDGYHDNYEYAYPLLKKHKIPATIYLTTSVIDDESILWFDELEKYILETKIDMFTFLPFNIERFRITSLSDKINLNGILCSNLKTYDTSERRKYLNLLKVTFGFNESISLKSISKKMLSWTEIREMEVGGVIFGAHSETHPILSKLPIVEAKKEIMNSKEIMECHLGHGVGDFAYPNGRKEDFTNEMKLYCKEIGFDTVASVHYGGEYFVKDPYDIPRIGSYSPIEMFSLQILMLLIKNRNIRRKNNDA